MSDEESTSYGKASVWNELRSLEALLDGFCCGPLFVCRGTCIAGIQWQVGEVGGLLRPWRTADHSEKRKRFEGNGPGASAGCGFIPAPCTSGGRCDRSQHHST